MDQANLKEQAELLREYADLLDGIDDALSEGRIGASTGWEDPGGEIPDAVERAMDEAATRLALYLTHPTDTTRQAACAAVSKASSVDL